MKKGIRRCIQCRVLNDRHVMHQINRLTTGIDALPAGRSMYVCQNSDCIQGALKNRRYLKQYPGLTQANWQAVLQKLEARQDLKVDYPVE